MPELSGFRVLELPVEGEKGMAIEIAGKEHEVVVMERER